jgi:hypothetical protein
MLTSVEATLDKTTKRISIGTAWRRAGAKLMARILKEVTKVPRIDHVLASRNASMRGAQRTFTVCGQKANDTIVATFAVGSPTLAR